MKLNMAFCTSFFAAASHNAAAFVSKPHSRRLASLLTMHMSSSTSTSNISRLDTLQTLLNKAGAPGVHTCNIPGDLEPVNAHQNETLKLHPHLYPIAKSTAKPDHYICALRRAYADDALYESSTNAPWPIVEAKLNGPGYTLLSLNSEHMMRRMAAQADGGESSPDVNADEIVDLYNEHLGKGLQVVESAFDNLYDRGAVEKLGYGVSKYVLLRVGPFPDLYEEMASQHSQRGDESSALIAAEAANGKLTVFASTFKFYAELLSSFPNREDEVRDAARVCLRMALPSIGMNTADFVRVSQLAALCTRNDDRNTALDNMKAMFEKIKNHEEENEKEKANMTPEQVAIEDANQILDKMVFVDDDDRDWTTVRKELGDIYASAGLDEMASFVDPSRS